MVKRIDELGRIVIPKEIRKSLKIRSGEKMEIIIEDDFLILKKYSELENWRLFAQKLCDAIAATSEIDIIITDTEKIVASSNRSFIFSFNHIGSKLTELIEKRKEFQSDDKVHLEIIQGLDIEGYFNIIPILNEGDSIGAVVIVSPINKQENENLAKIITNLISCQMEI